MTQPTEVPELDIESYDETDLKLMNVRIVYPSLFQTAMFNQEDTGYYECRMLIPKEDEHAVAMLNWYMESVAAEKNFKPLPGKTFVRDPEQEGKEAEYLEGQLIVTPRSKFPPKVYRMDGDDMIVLDEESCGDKYCYSGSYCHVLIRGWAMIHKKYGKRVGAYLVAICHAADGERISGGGVTDEQAASAFGAAKVRQIKRAAGPPPSSPPGSPVVGPDGVSRRAPTVSDAPPPPKSGKPSQWPPQEYRATRVKGTRPNMPTGPRQIPLDADDELWPDEVGLDDIDPKIPF